jgi:hypothetical protein
MTRPLTIGNAQGFWGDSIDAPARMMRDAPDLDYLTLDYLAEVSLSIMAIQRDRDPEAGYARDVIDVARSLAPFWKKGQKTKLVTNAGGLNPAGCARAMAVALREAGCTGMTIGVVTGDDVLAAMKNATGALAEAFRNWENHTPLDAVRDRLMTANAYTGARGAVDALAQGADIVLTGRMADPCMGLAPAMHHYGWSWDDFDRLAAGILVGHLIECGSQCCGGISTEWLDLPDLVHMGFPVCEVEADGSFVVTMPPGSGGSVNRRTVTEQILYEIGDPGNYLCPDVTVDLLGVRVEEVGENRVRVSGAKGTPPPDTLKVNATYRDGYRASGQITIFGRNAVAKARKSGDIILDRLREAGYTYARTNVECLGAGACAPGVTPEPELLETVMRISVADPDKAAVERFTKEIAVLACGGAQGTTGYAGGRPSVSPVFGFWPCLIDRERIETNVEIVEV